MATREPLERFYAEQEGPSWCVRDREITYTLGAARGKPWRVQWCQSQEQAERIASELNRTRGHAVDEPHCVDCGAQPADGDPPRCGSCHSRLARD